MIIKKDEAIATITTFKNKGTVKELIIFKTMDKLQKFVREAAQQGRSYYVLGKGSNVIIDPKTKIDTFVMLAPEIRPIAVQKGKLRVNAGISAQQLIKLAKEHKLTGFEFLTGVQASVGGMVYMNFSCWQKAIADLITKVLVVDREGTLKWLTVQECAFGYRQSIFQEKKWIIMEVEFKAEEAELAQIESKIRDYRKKRQAAHPLKEKTFGSVFKNPQQMSAGQVLDKLGLKGFRHNNVMVSDKHANFLINKGNAEFDDILYCIKIMKQKVKDAHNLDLDLEVKLVQ
jgi:UDP-N-acetylmuramate dehydrogenase